MSENNVMDLLTVENITLLIALWGAVLATAKILFDYTRHARRVKVYLAQGFFAQENVVGPNTISISATNTGYRDVTLNSMGFILPDKKWVMIRKPQSNVSFPYTLSEGKECNVWKIQRELAQELKNHGYSGKVKLIGYYRSAIGTIFKSKPMDFDVEKALTETD